MCPARPHGRHGTRRLGYRRTLRRAARRPRQGQKQTGQRHHFGGHHLPETAAGTLQRHENHPHQGGAGPRLRIVGPQRMGAHRTRCRQPGLRRHHRPAGGMERGGFRHAGHHPRRNRPRVRLLVRADKVVQVYLCGRTRRTGRLRTGRRRLLALQERRLGEPLSRQLRVGVRGSGD